MMKKTKKVLGIIAIAVIIGFAAIACVEPGDNTTAHTHTAGAAATCLTPQTCTTCGEVMQAATGHNFGDDSDWSDDAIAATCIHPSKDTKACKNAPCGEIEDRTGSHPALGHDLSGAKAATCMEDGNTGIGHCNRCNEDLTGETIPKDPDNHDFSGEPVITPAVCEIAGKEVISCGNAGCNVKQETVINALEHDWEWTENSIATSCEHASKDTATCNNTPCTATNERTGNDPALGHDLPGAKAATCTETGITGIGHCDRCGEDLTGKTLDIDPDNHNFGEWTQTAATCVSPEIQTRVCSYNNAHIEEQNHGEIDPTAHDWGDGWKTKTAATCIAPERQERVCEHNAAHEEEQNHGEINPNNHVSACTPSYVITGSGTAFTANYTYSECAGSGTAGTAGQPIQDTVNAIRTHAAGNAVTIQFGNGTDLLDIGSANAAFNNTGGTWTNPITLTGRITSANTSTTQGTVALANTVSINSAADIANTVNSTNGRAVYNGGTGTLTISGGTVSATTGQAVNNASTGKIIVSGTAIVTSANETQNVGTIVLASSGSATEPRLEILGGTVRNTANNVNARAVYNASTGAITISGGTVGAMTTAGDGTIGIAVWNNGTGAVTISGTDTVITSANTTAAAGTVNNNAGGTVTINGGTVRNIANSANARAVRNSATGTVNISGGTVSALTFAVLSENTNPRLTLNNRPVIIGNIRTPAGGLIADSGFNPGANEFILNFASYVENDVLVAGGAAFIDNFFVAHNGFIPVVSGADIVASVGSETYSFHHQAEGSVYTITRRKGTGSTEIQPIIDAIRTAAGGNPVTIHFGGGLASALDIGTQSVSFNNAGEAWGLITLTGRITSANYVTAEGTIVLADTVSISSSADIANTAIGVYSSPQVYSNVIRNNGTGSITITGGTISSAGENGFFNGTAIWNNSTGTITITGGTVIAAGGGSSDINSATIVLNGVSTLEMTGGTVSNIGNQDFSSVIRINSSAVVNISGGTVSTNNGRAIHNRSTGAINISGANTIITSGNSSADGGTINNAAGGTITISGGTVRNNHISGNNLNAIRNGAAGTVTISGGTVEANNGVAVRNDGTGAINISGANTVITSANPALERGTINNSAGGYIVITGGTITNTANNANANAIRNGAAGTITLSNCTVQANAHADAHAIRNVTEDTSRITISSGVTILGNLLNCPE